MVSRLSARRMTENQAVFRDLNKKFQRYLKETNKIAAEEGQVPVKLKDSTPLYFYCECSDENCRQRIKVSSGDYSRIHKANDTFVIAKDHAITDIEKVVSKKSEYWVVKKFLEPPKTVTRLNLTEADNA